MAPKTERFELRLEANTIGQVDQWRAKQADLPSRSEAIRQLVQTGLETTTTRQLFVAAKFQIVTAALTPGPGDRISDAYVYAWDSEVYPMLHEAADWHKPFASSFPVNKEMVEQLLDYLDNLWVRKKVPTFYKLEDHYDLRSGHTPWDRAKLIHVCKYAYLSNTFDGDFWNTLLAPTEHPSEARSITSPFNRTDDLYYH